MVKNEEYWIYYVLRDLFKIFPKVLVLDTGSTDNTLDIIKSFNSTGKLLLIESDYGTDDLKIGNGRNVLREECPTHWMFLVDGDEIWLEDQLIKLVNYEFPKVDVGMILTKECEDVDGQLKLRSNDLSNRDRIFSPEVFWNALSYPFEGYDLVGQFIDKGRGHYIPDIFAYHVRHSNRSSKNSDAFFRQRKYDYYPYKGPWENLPEDWLGEINPEIRNPYVN